MNTSLLFDESYCNQLLDEMARSFHRSTYGPEHLKKEPSVYAEILLSKKFIQLAQINVALDQILQLPHLEECFQKLSILHKPFLNDPEFLNEMNSFFTSDYGNNIARNYAISLKRYIDLIRYSMLEFLRMKQEIFDTDVQKWKVSQVDAFRKNVQSNLKEFIIAKEQCFLETFHRLEVYVEKKRFHKIVAILES
jgi:hypothetical protein